MENPINVKQILNQIESVVKDVSNVKEKDMTTIEEYENIKVLIEQLQMKTNEVKLQMDNLNEDVDLVDWQNHDLSIENTHKEIEKSKTDFEQIKKGKLSHQVSS